MPIMLNMHGLGLAPESQAAIDGFVSSTPRPSSAQITDFLKLYTGASRDEIAQGLIATGVDATKVSSAMKFLTVSGSITSSTVWGMLALVSAAASGYHGIKRNRGSVGWGVAWFLIGGLAPILTPVVAVAQGFAKPK